MSSLSRFPRLVLACALAALAAGGLLLVLKATDGPAAAGPAPLAPAQFPPAGRDCFDAEALMEIVFLGPVPIPGPVTIHLTGSSSISRTAPYSDPAGLGEWIDTEMVALTLRGHSPELGGEVTVTLQAAQPSTGTIHGPAGTFPADSFFDIFIEIETPSGVFINPASDPLKLYALIHNIPPIGSEYNLVNAPVPLQEIASQAPVGDVIQFLFRPTVERECWFWKAGGWEDYAPSGMPDFGQKQNDLQIGPPWTYCGPVAAANSLWWLDSKLEPFPRPPTVTNDHFPLVGSYAPAEEPWDDHWISNTVPLVKDLAGRFGTGPTGTYVGDMYQGIIDYIRDGGLADDFEVVLQQEPSFEWVTGEVTRSEDVILLLGLWECVEWPGEECEWVRLGGHYVTVAGVDPIGRFIAFSDPFFDRAEEPGGAGRVLSGTLIAHTPIPGHPSYVHNDAGNVSHDIYRTIESSTEHFRWGLAHYDLSREDVENFHGQNFPELPPVPPPPYQGGDIAVEVEYALATSPVPPKPSIMKETEEREITWGGVITYNITYGNDGGITGLDARIVDTLPAGVTYLDSTPPGIHAGGVVTWTFPTLPPHVSSPLTVTAQVSFGLPIGDPLTNTVYLYLGTGEWDGDDVTSYVTGTQVLLPVVLRDFTGS